MGSLALEVLLGDRLVAAAARRFVGEVVELREARSCGVEGSLGGAVAADGRASLLLELGQVAASTPEVDLKLLCLGA
jgi:hypothetical protein